MSTAHKGKPPRIMLETVVVPRMILLGSVPAISTSAPDDFGVGGCGGNATWIGVGGSAERGRFPLMA